MGQAKHRKQTDPVYGQPRLYLLQLFDKDNTVLVEIPLAIARQSRLLFTHRDALSMAGVLLSYLTNPTPANWHSVEAGITQYCKRLDSIPDLATFKGLAIEPPVAFWGWVREAYFEADAIVLGEVLESRDRGVVCKVTFASRPGIAPQQQGVEMKQIQGAVFENQLLRKSA